LVPPFQQKNQFWTKGIVITAAALSSQNKSGPAKQQAPDFPLFPAV
jgi:hypothetical protein